jgi:hypothetical protein
MFQVLVPAPTRKNLAAYGHRPEAALRPAARPMTGISGTVDHDRVAVFAHLEGQLILCHAGNLWVTIENDTQDHVLPAGQYFFVPTAGKVVISGRGGYTI